MRRSLLVLSLALAAMAQLVEPAAAAPVAGGMKLGFTHGQYSADSWGKPEAVQRARTIISQNFTFQAQHIMGWGATNPQPSPGVYDFRSLDARVELMRSTGATPVITLCCSPDWMKGGQPGTTDWNKIEVAPKPANYDDFAALAAKVARRYPDVKHFIVWNELKGFYDKSRNRWDIESYTKLYNKVAAALKAVDPTIQVGGPYIPMDSWSSARVASHPSTVQGAWGVLDRRALDALDYWLANANYKDFVAVDGGTATKDKGLITDAVTATQKFADVTAAMRARTNLPIWWAEVHLAVPKQAPTTTVVAAQRSALTGLEAAGTSVAMLWAPDLQNASCACLWSPTATVDGGRATPLLTGIEDLLVSRRRR